MAAGSSQRWAAAQRRRLGDDLVFAAALADDGKRRAALEIRLHHDDFVVAVAVEIGEPGFKILEHRVVLEPHNMGLAVAGLDHQGAGLDLVAENAVVVAADRLGQPGARDVALAADDAAVGQGAFGAFLFGRRLDEIELWRDRRSA